MSDPEGRGRAALVAAGVEFDERDAALLRAIGRTGSIAGAASTLERSRARALRRVEALEDAFGSVVERRRGGQSGGGSELTPNGRDLLQRYERLAAVLAATAAVPEAILEGVVTDVDGELADVRTDVGPVRGIHDGASVGDAVTVRIGADAITVYEPGTDPEPDATSARNRRRGSVADVDRGETVSTIHVDVDGARFPTVVTAESARRLGLDGGTAVALSWKATATRIVPRA